jgi:peptide/nickel transport system substrate-binding protein
MVAAGMLAAACGGGSGTDGDEDPAENGDVVDEESATSTTDVLDNPRWANVVRGPQASDEEPTTGGSIVVALETEANSYLPTAFQGGPASLNVALAIYDPLMMRDADGELRPYLAESLEPNDDFTEWTLRLRPGVRFHDGTTLDAEALKRIFDDYLTAEGTNTREALRFVERMDVVDDLTVTYVMTQPDTELPDLLTLPMGWPFSPDAADQLGDDFGSRPVGTGPFRFVSWQRDGDFVLERNEDYWQNGLPHLDRVTFRVIPDEATRVSSLASGDVDATQSSSVSSFVADVADIDGVTVALGAGNVGNGLFFNTAQPPTDDVRVRQALAFAVDQQGLLEVAAGEAAALTEARTQFFPQGSPWYSETAADQAPSHDPERARELYEDYVNDPNRSDGKGVGEPVTVSINVTNIPTELELGAAYEGFYEEIGFDVTVRALDQSAKAAALFDGDFQVNLARNVGRNGSPLSEFEFYFGEESPVNFTKFHDDVVDETIDSLRTAADLDDQAALAERMALHLAEELPVQWLAGALPAIAASDDVRGIRSWVFPDGQLGDGVGAGAALWGQVWVVR